MKISIEFYNITLLITHYNRSNSLQRLLQSFHDMGFIFGDIVVSDDGSEEAHINAVKKLQNRFLFRLLTTEKNKGLGNNINKGQRAVNTPYTIYVQEDFVPMQPFSNALSFALTTLQNRPELDMARFYAYVRYPYLKSIGYGFSEMIFKPWSKGYKKFYIYSDHPHLRRSNFLEKFGNYPEGIKGDATEYGMMMKFLQKKGKGIFYEDFKGLFKQVNSDTEPSTMTRNSLRNSEAVLITFIRNIYRHLRFNFDYHFKK